MRARCGPCGGLAYRRMEPLTPWRAVKLHVNSSSREWQHMVRQHCIRVEQMQKANQQNPTTFDYEVDWLDWEPLKTYQGAAPGQQTARAKWINTKSRAALRFHDPTTPQCEHGFDSLDVHHHRFYHCIATMGLRRFIGLTTSLVEMVDAVKKSARDCAIWEYPMLARDIILSPLASCGLWPSQQWLQALQDTQLERQILLIEVPSLSTARLGHNRLCLFHDQGAFQKKGANEIVEGYMIVSMNFDDYFFSGQFFLQSWH